MTTTTLEDEINTQIDALADAVKSLRKQPTLFVVITGNPIDGFDIIGPASSHDEAVEWCKIFLDGEWWVTELNAMS